MAEFLSKGSAATFESVLKLYPQALSAKTEEKKKKKGESLKSLDKWMQEELKSSVDSRNPPHLIRQELVRLVEWKLSRGKFRPRLVDFAASNPEEKVVSATTKGIKSGRKGKLEEAVSAIVTLKGIGPATASAILGVCCPQRFCFFADEVARPALGLPPSGSLKYSVGEYVGVNEGVTQCADRLNKEAGGEKWTPHRVELALWSYCVLEKMKPHLLPSSSLPSSSSPSSSSPSSTSSSSPSPPPAKKRKS